MNRKPLRPNLQAWRDAERLTQGEAAQKLGVSQPYYSRLERRQEFPHRVLGKSISDETGVPLETVLGLS